MNRLMPALDENTSKIFFFATSAQICASLNISARKYP